MKNLRFLTICGATMLLVACTQDDVATTASYEAYKAAQPTPIAFSTYMGDQAVTRAGATGAMTTETLQTNGFGVFAYHTVAAYNSSTAPNFMYNQQVSYNSTSSAWTYNPVKYWPNDFSGSAVDNRVSDAATGSGTNGYLSFFAYAPYVTGYTQNNNTNTTINGASWTNAETTGITALSGNNYAGDPTLTFVNSGVDLLWGTAGDNTYNNAAGTTVTPRKYPNDNTGKAAVNVDLTKQTTGGKVNFAFKHALAKLGNITIDAFADVVRAENVNSEAIANTKITVTSVEIKASMPSNGTLNLASGVWTLNQTNVEHNYNFGLANTPALNSAIVEPESVAQWSDLDNVTGVPAATSQYTPANVAASLPFTTFFPGTQPTFEVKIVYTVRTQDGALAKGYSEVVQTIKKSFQFGSAFEMNKIYNLAIHLGLTSVKFTASVSEWTNDSTAAVDLPINVATPASANNP